jgi:ribonuclease Z
MELVFLGTSAAIPTVRRNVTSVCVQMERESLLVDAGEGTQMQILRAGVRRGRIDRILITHLHGDHFFGLIGLLNSYQLGKREEPLQVLGPPGLDEYIRFMKRLCQTDFGYELTVTELPGITEPTVVLETADYSIQGRTPEAPPVYPGLSHPGTRPPRAFRRGVGGCPGHSLRSGAGGV